MITTGHPRTNGLPASARSILRLLSEGGPATRPQLARALDLSKPTVSESVTLLQREELVDIGGSAQGSTGRSAAVCQVSDRAGCVIGLDAGSTHVQVRVQTLDGRSVAEESVGTSPRQRHINMRTIEAATALLGRTLDRLTVPVRTITVAVPTSVSPTYREPGDYRAMQSLLGSLRETAAVDLEVENNVNCAAVGEHRHGAALGEESFSYLQIGVKVGLGTILRHELFRGAHSAAGEPACIPFPWGPGVDPEPGQLEKHLGAASLMRRCREAWTEGRAPRDAAELFRRARAADPVACSVVDAHARDIGRLLATVVCLMDPGVLVLGGGIGQSPVLVPTVAKTVSKLAWPTRVLSTRLGDQATVLGAAALAADRALDEICGVRTTRPPQGMARAAHGEE